MFFCWLSQLANYQVKFLEMEEKLQEAETANMKIKCDNLMVAELETNVKKLDQELKEIIQREEVDGDLDATSFALQQRLEYVV